MARVYIEADADGVLSVRDEQGQELARFDGRDALEKALGWAQDQRVTLYSSLSPDELAERYGLFYRRLLRRLRLSRQRANRYVNPDPPNVRRIVVPNLSEADTSQYSEAFSDEEADEWLSDEEVELTPDDSEGDLPL